MSSQNFLEELKKYFDNTPKSKVLEDWAKTEAFDKIGPTMDDFLSHTNLHFKVSSTEPPESALHLNTKYSPKFSLGFFL